MAVKFLQKFLPPEERIFYTYFEDAAEVAFQSAVLFHDIIFIGFNDARFQMAKKLKAQSSNTCDNIINALNKTFITPFDREDILQMAFLLNKITKRVIRGCVNMKVYRLDSFPEIMREQSETLVEATAKLKVIVGSLTKESSIESITALHGEMATIEHDGDAILYQAMDQLFSGQYSAIDIIKLRDIYQTIESALDNCFNVSNTVFNLTLKNS